MQIIEHFISASRCEELRQQIDQQLDENPDLFIDVDNQSLLVQQRFLTINGDDLREMLPQLPDLMAKSQEAVDAHFGPKLRPLKNHVIGQSLNVTERSGLLSWHYDRNLATAVIYISGSEGGLLEFYRQYRVRIRNNHVGWLQWVQRGFDAMMRPPFVRALLGKKETLKVEPGTLVLFDSYCLHQVAPVTGGRRVALVLCFDDPDKVFAESNTADYYGHRGKKAKFLTAAKVDATETPPENG